MSGWLRGLAAAAATFVLAGLMFGLIAARIFVPVLTSTSSVSIDSGVRTSGIIFALALGLAGVVAGAVGIWQAAQVADAGPRRLRTLLAVPPVALCVLLIATAPPTSAGLIVLIIALPGLGALVGAEGLVRLAAAPGRAVRGTRRS